GAVGPTGAVGGRVGQRRRTACRTGGASAPLVRSVIDRAVVDGPMHGAPAIGAVHRLGRVDVRAAVRAGANRVRVEVDDRRGDGAHGGGGGRAAGAAVARRASAGRRRRTACRTGGE